MFQKSLNLLILFCLLFPTIQYQSTKPRHLFSSTEHQNCISRLNHTFAINLDDSPGSLSRCPYPTLPARIRRRKKKSKQPLDVVRPNPANSPSSFIIFDCDFRRVKLWHQKKTNDKSSSCPPAGWRGSTGCLLPVSGWFDVSSASSLARNFVSNRRSRCNKR